MKLTKIFLPITLGALLISTPVLAADWQPTFTPGQAVYIDPALSSSKAAPVRFGVELEQEIKALHDKSGVNYYVWAVQANNAPTDKPLGVAKADEAIASWGSQAGFPNDNYAVITWARRAEDASKGGVGINLSLGLKKFDVKPILKGRMPQNPKGAILEIANQISENKIAQAHAAKSREDSADLFHIVDIVIFTLLLWVIALVGGWGLIKLLKPQFLYKKEAEAATEKWSKAVKNATDIYMEMTSDDVIEFYGALSQWASGLTPYLNEAKNAVNRFLCLYQKAQTVSEEMSKLNDKGKYRTAFEMGEDVVHSVDFGKLPLEKASIFGGLNDAREYEGNELLAALDRVTKEVLSYWATLKYGKKASTPTQAIETIQAEVLRQERVIADSNRVMEEKQRQEADIQRRRRDEQYVQKAREEKDRIAQRSTTVIVDNSTTSYESNRFSERKTEDSPAPSHDSAWNSTGSDYNPSDSGSFGGDY
jgi:hypothetical protein